MPCWPLVSKEKTAPGINAPLVDHQIDYNATHITSSDYSNPEHPFSRSHQAYSILTELSCYKTFSKETERDVMYYAHL
jgi:hypothetical protein